MLRIRPTRNNLNLSAWAVEEFVDGAWSIYLVDYVPVFRPTRQRAQELVDMLNRGESIDHLQKRVPRTASWKCPV